jgi:tetratricopeptide (TPR) repeat protein
MAQRDRGQYLTDVGLARLEQSITLWEKQHGRKCTQELLKDLSKLDVKTISNIRKRKAGSDVDSLQRLFVGLDLELIEADYHIITQVKAETELDPNFVGRDHAIDDLNKLVSKGAKIIVIQARGGVGKTTLARKYLQQEFDLFLEFPIAKETKDIASVESLIEEKLRQLGEEPGREFLVSIERLKRKLQSERIGILIDNFEPALDSSGKLVEAHRRYVELLRILSDQPLKSVTLITSRERLREPSISVQHYPLRGLDVKAWEIYFCSRTISIDRSALLSLHDSYDGNAKAMDILSGSIVEDFSSSINLYWQINQDDLLIERDLEDLVIMQFDRLRNLDENAYNLLCRMGCYRYQDVPNIPVEGLVCLLWDVPEGKRRRVVKSLQDRSLVDFKDGKYWLHPVIREEAIERLRSCSDWIQTNQKAANFWVKTVQTIETIDDALQALEAYHHSIAIGDFRAAGDVVLAERHNNWLNISEVGIDLTCSLASSFIRLGLIQQMINSCSYLIDKSNNQPDQTKLYTALGDAYWAIGNVLKASEVFEISRDMAILDSDKDAEVGSLFNLGLCKEMLWETDEAISIYESVISLAENTSYKRYAAQAQYCLSHLYSCLHNTEKAKFYIEQVWQELTITRIGTRSTGYRLHTLGFVSCYLGDFEKSFEMYSRSIEYADKGGFVQLKALSFTGMAVLFRMKGEIEKSIAINCQAIDLLQHVGAKSFCANAYYQLGLTYNLVNENLTANENFQRAIDIFNEMEAPNQVEKVRRSMLSV